MGKKKCSYLTTFLFAPYVQQLLASKLQSVGSYVLLFDESLTNHMQMKQPDLHIRVWEDEKVATHTTLHGFLVMLQLSNFLKNSRHGVLKLENKVLCSFLWMAQMLTGPHINYLILTDLQIEVGRTTLSIESMFCIMLWVGFFTVWLGNTVFAH